MTAREPLKRQTQRQPTAGSQKTYRSALRAGVSAGALTPAVAGWSYSRQVQLQAAINWAYRRGELEQALAQSLIDAIPFPASPPRYVDRTPTESQADAFEAATNKLPSPRREIILLPLYLALRASEVLALKRGDVEEACETGKLRVWRKGSKEALLPCKPVLPLLQAFLRSPATWATVGDLVGGPTHESRLNKLNRMVKRVSLKVGFDTHTHALRHLCATRLLRRGTDVRNLQELLDHESLTTTTRYLRADLSKLDEVLQAPPEAPPRPAPTKKGRK